MTFLKTRLSVMMFVQYVIWGAWYVTLNTYLTSALKFSGTEAGAVFGTTAIASLVAPFLVGLLADRWFATERLMATLYVLCAFFLLVATQVTTFVPMQIGGKPYIVAGYTCTPIVAFDVDGLKPGQHVKGRTVAELGAGNTPTDLVAFNQGGKDVILVVNSRHPLMRLNAADVAGGPALTTPEPSGAPELRTPARAARAALDAQATANTFPTEIPCASAASWSNATARIAIPRRVRKKKKIATKATAVVM